MGLNCSHGAFDGAYSAFNRLRQCVAEAIGGSFPPHYEYEIGGAVKYIAGVSVYKSGFDDDLVYWPDEWNHAARHGIVEFLTHSDCDGKIPPEMCAVVADDLEDFALPRVKKMAWVSSGHIGRDGGYDAVLKKFIDGCRAAAAAGEPLEFG
jgi:hypothetical protein